MRGPCPVDRMLNLLNNFQQINDINVTEMEFQAYFGELPENQGNKDISMSCIQNPYIGTRGTQMERGANTGKLAPGSSFCRNPGPRLAGVPKVLRE